MQLYHVSPRGFQAYRAETNKRRTVEHTDPDGQRLCWPFSFDGLRSPQTNDQTSATDGRYPPALRLARRGPSADRSGANSVTLGSRILFDISAIRESAELSDQPADRRHASEHRAPIDRAESPQTNAQAKAMMPRLHCRVPRLSHRIAPRKDSLSDPFGEERFASAAVEFAVAAHFQCSLLHFALWPSRFDHRHYARLDRLRQLEPGSHGRPHRAGRATGPPRDIADGLRVAETL